MYTPSFSRAASAYRQVGAQSGVESASPHRLIQMLFEGLLQNLNAARGAIERGEVEVKGTQLGRAVRILEEGLKGSLNREQGGELAANLGALYDYCIQRLTHANLRNDVQAVEEVVSLVEPVAQGWQEIGSAPAAAAGQ
ncbi:flagellar biosynthesis protein FliS [Comamonas testosteroni TK102]|jgi:flagellar protein FliS|uniref:Flagellar secretion chaperone FliS n=1 Tax=Comamonas testosteroni TK102 TaxID=1392005 RepID=A0A076PLX2_COMTE|nr:MULTISPECIES: flagellar export chaperone FliS [Comamonas]AIJ44650.1 flagellar biosynthesis protein FliS [Comamonas testosteroni TK102]MPS87954.1 flagellar export chaperone FliS [Comamonas sp.]TYK71837.1 flagellar export chaperone FliS [Comamonas sp. Z3]